MHLAEPGHEVEHSEDPPVVRRVLAPGGGGGGGGGGGKRGREEERGEDRLAGGESKLKEKNRSNSLSSPQDHAD